MSATETANDIGAARGSAWAAVVRWMAVRVGEGYALKFEVTRGEGIRGAVYIATMVTPSQSELRAEALSPAAALVALSEKLREYEATHGEWLVEWHGPRKRPE